MISDDLDEILMGPTSGRDAYEGRIGVFDRDVDRSGSDC
jgi:hypothetical protein